jgi:two-component system, chemotaxis family, protein-glutamate methylesterase/glutaminase
MIRVLVIDDSLFMRTIITDMLRKDPEIEVIGVATNGEDGLLKIDELKPDVITLDIEMPKMDGIEVLKRKSTMEHQPKTLMLSSLTSQGALMTKKAMAYGADDFMLKPKDLARIRGISQELISKVKNLVNIAYVSRKTEPLAEVADKIVLIGSSAGGPPMLDVLLSSFTTTLPAAIMITQHMPEGGFTAALAARLNRLSPMPVKETENGDVLSSGQVYVSMAGYHTVISSMITPSGVKGGRIIHSRAPLEHSVRPAVNKTFTSAAAAFGPLTVSTILSGMGSDGGDGTLAVKQHGGTTMVCRESDCLVYGMARSALKLNCVDSVLPLRTMAGEITRVVRAMGG